MFIAYHRDEEEAVPVATGKTHDEAQSLAITRVLSKGLTFGEIAVRKNHLSQDDFTTLRETLDRFFAAE